MKALIAILLFAVAIQAVPISAQSTAASPLLGTWTVDVARLPIPPGARPKNVTFTFSETLAGKWSTRVDILGGDGSQRHMISTYSLDGTAVAIQGDTTEADTVAVKVPAPNVMVMALGKGGIPASTRVYTVSTDGKTMIETATYVGNDGKPMLRTNYLTRIR